MGSTITARGQTVIPAPIRERFSPGPSQRLRRPPGGRAAGRTPGLLLHKDPEFRAIAELAQEWLGQRPDPAEIRAG
ncbi:MAG: hypothetical protein AAFX65_05665 [Cyanobacteria bacterium J06638_7]